MKALVERIAQDKDTKKFDYDYLKNSYKFGTAYKREDFFLNMYGFIALYWDFLFCIENSFNYRINNIWHSPLTFATKGLQQTSNQGR